jgi:molecular chaperone DnaK
VECPKCKKINDEAATACEDCGHSLANAPEVGDTGLFEVTGLSLGIAAVKGSQRDAFVPIIPKGTQYPLPAPMRRSLQATDGRRIRVPVYEGDDPVASRNLEQGVVEYELPQEIDVNSPVDVSFNYDRSRIVTVTISVRGTSLLKTTTLRADTPRTPPPAAADEEDDAGSRRGLENVERIARQFLDQYEPYIEPAQAMKLRRDLDQAQQALIYSSDAEYRRMTNVLEADVFGSGLATQLFLAERATDGATPVVTSEINRAVSSLQALFQQGDRERVNNQARQLKLLVNKALQEREVGEVADAEDYGGLLRLLEES